MKVVGEWYGLIREIDVTLKDGTQVWILVDGDNMYGTHKIVDLIEGRLNNYVE